MSPKSSLRELAELILASVDVVESAFQRQGCDLPSLNSPPNLAAEMAVGIANPEALRAITIMVSAAQQLIATADNPVKRMFHNSTMV